MEGAPFAAQIEKELSLLKGVIAYAKKDYKTAADMLSQGLVVLGGNAPPDLSKQYIDALTKSGQKEKACTQAQTVYLQHPLLVKSEKLLSSCTDKKITEKLDAQRKETLLATKLATPIAVSALPLLNDEQQKIQLDLAAENKVTVLVFFATWCPHCQKEMPRLVDFAKRIAKDKELSTKAQLIGVRSSVARETEPYADFKKRFNINFPILTDESIAFEQFAVEQNKQPGYPMIAVIDAEGKSQYFLSHGDYNDSAQELKWVVESLVK